MINKTHIGIHVYYVHTRHISIKLKVFTIYFNQAVVKNKIHIEKNPQDNIESLEETDLKGLLQNGGDFSV